MAALSDPKHELFANLIFNGEKIGEAYEQAGFAPHASSASRLRKSAKIEARIEELQARQQKRHDVTVDTLTEKLAKSYAVAEKNDKSGEMTGAVMAMAKLHGLLVDRKEEGQPGDFINLTEEQKLKRAKGLAKDLGLDRIDGTILTPGLADQPAEGTA